MHLELPPKAQIDNGRINKIVNNQGNIVGFKSNVKYVMNVLAEDGYLEEWHVESAGIFMGLREVWLSPVGYVTSRLADEISSWLEGRQFSPPEIYDEIARQLKRPQIKIIAWAATTEAQEPFHFRNAITGQICHDAFVAMQKALDDIYERRIRK